MIFECIKSIIEHDWEISKVALEESVVENGISRVKREIEIDNRWKNQMNMD